jgi:hypothetical protein
MKLRTTLPLLALLILSLSLNVVLYREFRNTPRYISFSDANTRETYATVHRVKEAQRTATGRGIKVGILDKYFGVRDHPALYTAGEDFVGDRGRFERTSEHGYWMATTLKEIAPDVEVLALNVRTADRAREADAMIRAIDWALGRQVNILTYSAEAFRPEIRKPIDEAIRRAIDRNVVTTFIHYPLPENLLPTGFFQDDRGEEGRQPDLAVYPFDYNMLPVFVYEKYRRLVEAGGRPRTGDELPYLSVSSTSPVLAGIVAMMMEVKGGLPPAEYKRVLIATSRSAELRGRSVDRVVDAQAAIEHLKAITGR